MRILITGGTGFIGTHLCEFWSRQGHAVTAIGSRSAADAKSRWTHLRADTSQPGEWQQAVGAADVIVNLAGRSIFHRWSRKYKQSLYDSRILTTRNVVDAMPSPSHQILISASAVGFYGNGGDTVLTEAVPKGNDFLADLAADWEARAMAARDKGARVVTPRLGIVLGSDGGSLPAMLKAFRSMVGGPVGSGEQWVSWIHIADLVAAFEFLVVHADLQGAFNLCAPHPVRNRQMAETIGRLIHRPAKMPSPVMALRLMLGEFADVLVASQRVAPTRLLEAGFAFSYPELDAALRHLLGKEPS